MKVIDEGHKYEVAGGQTIQFIKRTNGELVNEGTTNEELLEVLFDRMNFLDAKFPCEENKEAIFHIRSALVYLNLRTNKRIEQGVETKDLPHVS